MSNERGRTKFQTVRSNDSINRIKNTTVSYFVWNGHFLFEGENEIK